MATAKVKSMAKIGHAIFVSWRWIPAIIVILMALAGILFPLIAPYQVNDFSFASLLLPSWEHLLGTNNLGQDIFTLLVAGFRTSIIIALSSAVLTTLIGTFMAGIATFYRGWPEKIIMRVTDLLIMVPEIVFILVFATFAGPGMANIVVVIAVFSWSRITRIIKARTDVAINSDRVQYTLLMKGGFIDIIRKMWRDIYPSVSTMFVLQCGKAVMYEADLALVGISDPSVMTWGRLIRQAIDYGVVYSGDSYLWWLIPPVVCLVLLVSSISFLVFSQDGKF
jgi:peptide/nickel transport system permease protein